MASRSSDSSRAQVQTLSGGLHQPGEPLPCQRLAHAACELLQRGASALVALRLPAGQQQVLVHAGAQEATVAVALHQVVDMVLCILVAVPSRVFEVVAGPLVAVRVQVDGAGSTLS